MGSQVAGRVWRYIAILTLVQLSASAATAQGRAHQFEVFIEGGASTFTNHSSVEVTFTGSPPLSYELLSTTTSLSTTGRLFSGVRYWLDSKEAIEASYSYSPSDLTQTQNCFAYSGPSCSGVNETEVAHHHFVSFNYVRALSGRPRLHPFLTGGLGLVYVHQPEFSPTHFAANFGGGVDFRISAHWDLRAEYRDFLLDSSELVSGSPTGLTHNQVPSIGLVYRF